MRKLVFCLMSPNPWKQTTADEKRQGLQSNKSCLLSKVQSSFYFINKI